MKHIYLNLKRFDVPPEFGGINRIAPIQSWAQFLVRSIQERLKRYTAYNAEFILNLPEAHILPALAALSDGSPLKIGCQSVCPQDIGDGKNFGSLTSLRPAGAAAAMGCTNTIIGHCEQRSALESVYAEAGVSDAAAVNRIFNKEIKSACKRNLSVLYCVGEKSSEQSDWQRVLYSQLEIGLREVDLSDVVIGYEPVWSIGPGKAPAGKEHIAAAARFIKKEFNAIDVVYGGGLRKENAVMLSKIDELDGGVIALTRFTGEIGFYPDEFLNFLSLYFNFPSDSRNANRR